MLFNSPEYLIFLPCVLVLYYLLRTRMQNRMLLVASYIFYSWWDWRFTSLLMISTVVDYHLSLAIHHSQGQRRRKHLLWLSLVVNFGMLGFFKYFNFFVDSAAQLLTTIGFDPHLPTLRVLLPAGISFYTFQTMNYTIDVYRRQLEPTRDFLTYALFVSYFPHLVAGPIIRAEVLLPQLLRRRIVTNDHLCTGGALILIGLFKKIVIADSLSHCVQSYFSHPSDFSSIVLLKGLYFFSLQIYGDFAGYTDIARGTSRLLGIELPENFNQPYLSRNMTEFWRRWHISLSTWLRDYLYIPLGGSRGGRWRTYRNLMITMFLGGLWHGANWTFVVWGTLHGLYLAVHKFLSERRPPPEKAPARWRSLIGIVATFHLVTFTWTFFRAPTFAVAFDYLRGIFFWHGGFNLFQLATPALFGALVLAIDLPQRLSGNHTVLLRAPWVVRGVAYAGMTFLIVVCGTGYAVPFIYFQF
ncbi:MAG: MBOAT family protein [Lentisphaerae bacterium]|nr:MBOAT family protein [Lentisphaerota bacterium]